MASLLADALLPRIFLVHVAQVIRAGWNKFRAMLIGYQVVPVETVNQEEEVSNGQDSHVH